MAKREVLGVMACPECGHPDAEVKVQKNGLVYRFCPECNAQYFPRTVDASARLLAKVGGAVTDTGTDTGKGGQAASVAAPAVPEKPIPLPKPKGTGNPLLDFVRGVA